MITGDTTIDIDKAFALGADDCIIKPIDMGFLVERLGKLLKKKFRILAVEDDRQICEVLKNMLTKQDYSVEILNDGLKLMETVNKVKPDLILLDISLPVGPDGVELCKQLKADASTKKIPVIMLTANEHSGSVDQSFAYGAEDYIFKPYSMTDLLQKIKKYLRKSDSKSIKS
jgi:DNA-binding response OmpR family regulator